MTVLPEVVVVFLLGLITALATGLGALPFVFLRRVSKRTVAWANAVAAGLMLGASFGLVMEGSRLGGWQTLVGGAVGVAFIQIAQSWLEDRDVHFGRLQGGNARQILLVVAIMTIHSLAEGVAVGVSFGGGRELAVLITAAVAVHNIPEGLAISAVMRPRGASLGACAFWSVFSSLPQPLMAVPAFLFVEAFRPFLPPGLGFAAGAMVYLVLLELLPEAFESASETQVGVLVTVSMGSMILFQQYL